MNFHHPYIINLGAALLGCFFIISCGNTDKEIAEYTKKRLGVEEARGITIIYSTGGKTKAQLTAPLMYRYQDTIPYVEFTKGLHADFFDDALTIESKLNALYGRYMETESKVFLKDSVVLFNRNGDTMFTKKLYWDRNRIGREFYTDDSVHIRTKTHFINGVGFESNQDFSNQVIYNPTNSIIRVPASQFPQ